METKKAKNNFDKKLLVSMLRTDTQIRIIGKHSVANNRNILNRMKSSKIETCFGFMETKKPKVISIRNY